MGQPAVVMNDLVTGVCAGHQIPGPTGSPVPSPPLPFSAPLTSGLATTVTIGGRAAAVQGSNGTCSPPHAGLHPSDPKLVPTTQQAQVVRGSSTVLFDGQPAAYTGCTVTACLAPQGMVSGTAANVLVGA